MLRRLITDLPPVTRGARARPAYQHPLATIARAVYTYLRCWPDMCIQISGQHISNLKSDNSRLSPNSTHNNYSSASNSKNFELVSSPDVLLLACQLVRPHIRWHNCCLSQDPPSEALQCTAAKDYKHTRCPTGGIHSQDKSGSRADKSAHCMEEQNQHSHLHLQTLASTHHSCPASRKFPQHPICPGSSFRANSDP